jgi:putative addiction module component (TIGR02574 family)
MPYNSGMSERAQAILSQVAQLPTEEQAEIADWILGALVPRAETLQSGDEWLAEVRRRADEMEQGQVEGVPWEVVRADGERLLREQG